MLHIDMEKLKGKTYTNKDNVTFICVGYGQNPSTGANYVVGANYDATTQKSIVATDLFRDVKFDGEI